ncbi:MAG: DNA alkylation repair protein, partial [Eubacterium sp.]|nr:DNA alkylation repair protein [Eubacterium sp.]
MDSIEKQLWDLQDETYREMQVKTLPTLEPSTIIGVRTPALRSLAKQMIRSGEADIFLEELPHRYFEENQLHAFILSEGKDYERCVDGVERFLPYVDNWATCDQMSPKIFKKHRQELLERIKTWIRSDAPYTIRFGVGMLMGHFLDEDFDPAYPEMVAGLRSEEYYVNMMIAWYFATALAKQYDTVLPYIEKKRLDDWTHNKAIQKSVE